MTCNDCANHDECEQESKASPFLSHKMWMIGFWENAEKRCPRYDGKKENVD